MVALAAYTAHNLPDGMEPGHEETRVLVPPTSPSRPAPISASSRSIPAPARPSFVNFVAADDFGRLINPMIVGRPGPWRACPGHRQALLEGAVYDSNGQPIRHRFMDYSIHVRRFASFKLSHTPRCVRAIRSASRVARGGAIGASAASSTRSRMQSHQQAGNAGDA